MKLILFLLPALVLSDSGPQHPNHPHDSEECEQDCSYIRCGSPPKYCPYGVGIPPCGCCPVCLEKPDEPTCGRPYDKPCPYGLVCQDGVCVEPPTYPPPRREQCAGPYNKPCPKGLDCLDDKCQQIPQYPPYGPPPVGMCYVPCATASGDEVCKPDCSTVLCPAPEDCYYGSEVPPCECCPVCKKKPDEPTCGGPYDKPCPYGLVCQDGVCVEPPTYPPPPREQCAGPYNKPCPKGLDCLDDKCQQIPQYPPYGPPPVGMCYVPSATASGYEVCVPDCSTVKCKEPKGCYYGTEIPPCECCPVCKEKADEPTCGGPYDKPCPYGLICQDGVCVEPLTHPPTYPPPQREQCAGPYNKPCPKGLDCLDDKCQQIPQYPPYGPPPVGMCYVPCATASGYEVCVPDCSTVKCKEPKGCYYGTEIPPCECCPVCKEKPDEPTCGGPYDKPCPYGLICQDGVCVEPPTHPPTYPPPPREQCAGPYNKPCPKGLDCLDDKCQQIPQYPPYGPPPVGMCYVPCATASGYEVCVPDCSTVYCEEPKGCYYGTEIPPCECCPVCKKKPDEPTCGGPYDKPCPYGLICQDGVCVEPPTYPPPPREQCAGPYNKPCPKGLDCLDDKCQQFPQYPDYGPPPVGMCYVPCATASGYEVCKPNCSTVLCPKPKGCYYGTEIPPCECCPVCKTKPDEPTCGRPYDKPCPYGLICQDGVCVEPPTYPPPPREQCAGPYNKPCPKGLDCLDDKCMQIPQYPPYGPPPVGMCYVPCETASGDEVCKPDCSTVLCPKPTGCYYGTEIPPCECCPVCKTKPDEPTCGRPYDKPCPYGLICQDGVCVEPPTYPPTYPEPERPTCGGPYNKKCPRGLVCLDDSCQELSNYPRYGPPSEGKCYAPCEHPKSADTCQPDCSDVLCPPIKCKYGSEIPPCECCPVCLKGPGDPCGGPNNREGGCPPGLVCNDKNCNVIPDDGGLYGLVGECGKPCKGLQTYPRQTSNDDSDEDTSVDTCRRNCYKVGCPEILCLYGSVTPPCECCPICLKGPGEECAGPNNQAGNCGKGLVCLDKEWNEIPVKGRDGRTPFGTCQKPKGRYNNVCFPICPLICPKINPRYCKFGLGDNPCTCCDQCAKGPGESCGGPNNKEGSCGEGLICIGSYGRKIPKNGGPGTPQGHCQPLAADDPAIDITRGKLVKTYRN